MTRAYSTADVPSASTPLPLGGPLSVIPAKAGIQARLSPVGEASGAATARERREAIGTGRLAEGDQNFLGGLWTRQGASSFADASQTRQTPSRPGPSAANCSVPAPSRKRQSPTSRPPPKALSRQSSWSRRNHPHRSAHSARTYRY